MQQELVLPVINPPKVMIVEDEMIIARDIQMQLSHLGFAVTAIVASAADAFQSIERDPPDLVLMDIRIKGEMDGIQAAAVIRSRHKLPVIYLTSHSDNATVQRAQVTEPFGYIQKPLGKINIKAMLIMALHKHRQEKQRENGRSLLSDMLDSISDAVLVADHSGETLFLNRAAVELTGWTLDEALGRNLLEIAPLYAPDGREISAALIQNTVTQGAPFPIPPDSVLIAKAGLAVEISGQFAPTSLGNNSARVCLTLRDVTAQRLEDQRLRQEQHMFIASELAHGVALEFYGLFDLIEGTASDLMESHPETNEVSQLELLRRVSRVGAELSTQLLELREGYGSAHVVNLSEEMLSLESMLQRLCGAGIKLEISCAPNVGYILSTGTHLEQMLLHLVLEGKRSIDGQGSLALHADVQPRIPPTARCGSYVRLSLRAKKSQVSRASTDQPFPLGFESPQLGLAVLRAMAIASDGFTRLHATDGIVSLLEVFLPRHDSRLAATTATNEYQNVVLLIGLQPRIAESLRRSFSDSVLLLEASSLNEAVLISNLYPGDIDLIVQNQSQFSALHIGNAHLRIRAHRPNSAFLGLDSPSDNSGMDPLNSSQLEQRIKEYFKTPGSLRSAATTH